MKPIYLTLYLTLTCSLLMTGSTVMQAQNLISDDAGWTELNLAVTDELVIPAYQRLIPAAENLVRASDAFCTSMTGEELQNLQAAYHRMMDSWQAVQHIQFGPVTYFNWNFRMQYWPDDRGTGARQLAALINAGDEEIFSGNNFARQSVGIQGLPALESLLFAENALNDFQENDYLCPLTRAIAANLTDISNGVSQRWTEEYRAVVLDPAAGGVFEDAQDLSIEFLKALQEAIAKVRDLKIAPVVGDSLAGARNRQAESWRSARSLANIKINIASLDPLFDLYAPAFHEEDAVAVQTAFDALEEFDAGLPDSYAAALADADSYAQLQQLYAVVDSLHEALEGALKNTDLYLGFNSLDGD